MTTTSIRSSADLFPRVRFDAAAAWTWFLCLALVVYLSLEGGGYDPLVDNKVAIAVWWAVLLAALVGAVPRGRLRGPALAALGLLALFAVWTALSLTWTESTQRTWADVARIVGYVGIFALVLSSTGSERGHRILSATGAAIFVVTALALLSRLHPAWFPNATVTANLLNDPERLSYPINYWNGVGMLVAIGIPLLLQQASEAKTLLVRGLAAAAVPAMPLTIFFTLSRGGIAAAALAVLVWLVFSGDRGPKLLTCAITLLGGAILVVEGASHDALRHGLDNATAHSQGNTMLLLTIVVCVVVGIVQVAVMAALERGRPSWTHPTPQQTWTVTAIAVIVVIAAAIGLGAPGKVDNAWHEFKSGGNTGEGASRLGSAAGESRYQLWSTAVEENESKPLTGTGSGTFEFWWDRYGTTDTIVKDTHSLWMQTLGEVGIVGLVLLIGFLGVVVVGGAQRLLRLGPERRSGPAAALGGVLAFCLVASFDWMWQLPAVVAALLLLSAALVGPWHSARDGAQPLALPWRAGFVVVAVVAIIAIALPFATTSQVRKSEEQSRAGELAAALSSARSAQNVLPGTAAPRLQEALVLEEMGRYGEATEAAEAAAEREETNWRNYLVLARVEAENGQTTEALADYRMARSLYPRLEIFQQQS